MLFLYLFILLFFFYLQIIFLLLYYYYSSLFQYPRGVQFMRLTHSPSPSQRFSLSLILFRTFVSVVLFFLSCFSFVFFSAFLLFLVFRPPSRGLVGWLLKTWILCFPWCVRARSCFVPFVSSIVSFYSTACYSNAVFFFHSSRC